MVTVEGVSTPLWVPIAIAPPLSDAVELVIVFPFIVTVALAPCSTLIAPPNEAIAELLSFPRPVIVFPSILWVPLPTISIKPPANDTLEFPLHSNVAPTTLLVPPSKQNTPPLTP